MKIFILALSMIALLSTSGFSADTRGLRVVAKDQATGQTAEVPIYNKTYAVIIGIDKYTDRNIRPLQYAVPTKQEMKDFASGKGKLSEYFTAEKGFSNIITADNVYWTSSVRPYEFNDNNVCGIWADGSEMCSFYDDVARNAWPVRSSK